MLATCKCVYVCIDFTVSGVVRQERVLEDLFSRARDARSLLCSSLSLGQLSKGLVNEEKVCRSSPDFRSPLFDKWV